MLRQCSLIGLVVCALTAPALAQPQRGDYLVVSRTRGTVYAVDPTTGLIRSLISGLELRDTSGTVRGAGLTFDASFRTSLAVTSAGEILARFSKSATSYGLTSVAAESGDRALLPGTDGAEWDQSGDVLALEDGTVLTTADDWDGAGNGRILRYDVTTGLTTVITGPTVGDGPVM